MGNETTLLGILVVGMILHLPRLFVVGLMILAVVSSRWESGGKRR